jgi:N-acetyl sugar amidotransferase
MTSLFGLPEKVEHCKKCLLTNQKPFSVNETKNFKGSKKNGLKFKNGICAACQYAETKTNGKIDWNERESLLKKLLDKYRKNGEGYDCIVSGSGGKDSSTIAHILKYKYNMNPLTVTYSPILYTDIGFRNLRAWIDVGGFDNILFSPNGKLTSILAREAFINLLHPMQPFKFGIKSIAAKTALKYDIKLVMFGEPYAEYGSEDNSSVSSPSYNIDWIINDSEDIFFGGTHYKDIIKKYQWVKENDLNSFMPLRSKDLEKSNLKDLQIEFLGWYLPWNPQEVYYYASKNCGYFLDTQRTDGTYGRYAGIDDKMEWLHYYTHYIKYGIGRTRFDACQEIRSGHITRDEGIKLCKKFEGEYPKRYIDDCFAFMNLTKKEAHQIIDNFRSPHLWKKKTYGWKRLQELSEINFK